MPGETFTESFPAVPEAVADARNALTGFARDAGADPELLEAVRLAASEAVTNAVMHAYRDREAGTVHVSASYVENELWLLVADAGDGLRPHAGSTGLGLGLALIAQLADDFQILSRGSGGTELRLRFNLARSKPRGDRRTQPQAGSRPQSRGSARERGSVSSALSPA
ncbi:MAG TPA: ATP-binding protein [Solirubrobacteraceae bacterium]|nr:ATP-binding protein [Solirubrobacteraceae bacterium]